MFHHVRLVSVAVLAPFTVALSASDLLASQDNLKVFAHRLHIEHNEDTRVDELLIDGKKVYENASLAFEKVTKIDGVGVVIGTTSIEGNLCGELYFVLSFRAKQRPKLYEPIGDCKEVSYEIGKKGIHFKTEASAGNDGGSWYWSASDGLKDVGAIKHVPDPNKGWKDLDAKKISHPHELMDYGEIASAIMSLLGKDSAKVLPLIAGTGAVEYKTGLLVGTGCQPHECDSHQVLILADLKTKKIMLAWNLAGHPTVVRGFDQSWPASAKAELKVFRKPSK
jgi:hypothetical protein